ncbi:MAG: sugar phosphate isomerase/epimerase family protein [Lachnospiraceae bacterium]
MNKLGLSIHPWWVNGNLDKMEKELEAIAYAGAECCELVLQGMDVIIGGNIIPERFGRIRRMMLKFPLQYTLHLPYELNLLDVDAALLYRKVFLAGIEFARMTDIKVIVYHAGSVKNTKTETFERLRQEEAALMRELAVEAGDICICMENAPFYDTDEYSAGKSAEEMVQLVRMVDMPNFNITFDIGHSYMSCAGDHATLLENVRKVLPYVGHIHLHDNFGISLPMTECDYNHRITCGAADIHLPLGWGEIPLAQVMKILCDYQGIINLEIEKRFEDQYENSLAFVRRTFN